MKPAACMELAIKVLIQVCERAEGAVAKVAFERAAVPGVVAGARAPCVLPAVARVGLQMMGRTCVVDELRSVNVFLEDEFGNGGGLPPNRSMDIRPDGRGAYQTLDAEEGVVST